MNNGIKILDLGCGDGRWLKENGDSNVVGIDIDPKASSMIPEDTHFILSDARYLPFKNKTFEYVHINQVLHHVAEFDKSLKEVDRVLDGHLEIVETVNDAFLIRMARRLIKNWRGMKVESFFTSSQLESKIRNMFIIERVETYNNLPISDILYFLGVNFRLRYAIYQLNTNVCTNLFKRLGLSKYWVTAVKIIAMKKYN